MVTHYGFGTCNPEHLMVFFSLLENGNGDPNFIKEQATLMIHQQKRERWYTLKASIIDATTF